MEKRLKTGLIFMVAAVVLMPIAILLKNSNETLTIAVLIFTMLLELIGLIFVIMSILKRKKI
ncbi:hypothetical protein EZ428_00245 [Pedobacter frigiditerrae]|uniref:Uncharacterized protein n=1 Tax=Pedobacter frigiditerrae TaxID=2530452 RepID=A0A4R0N0K1_9SPHI|nr:hypothetical protein [Pedobacter frigiditerrae]TCC93239.1 hypothetical protein EZ428_00245 [Pedobacter frigiditerrae]